MSSKVANLIALELAVLIAIMSWLAFSNLRGFPSSPSPRSVAPLVDSCASAGAPCAARSALLAPVDYPAELAPEPSLEEAPAQTIEDYETTSATEPALDPGLNTAYLAPNEPSYTVLEPQPLLASPDCLAPPVNQFLVYPQTTALVVVSNSQSIARRPRTPIRTNGFRPNMNQRRPPNMHRPPRGRDTVAPRTRNHQQPPQPRPRPRPRQNL